MVCSRNHYYHGKGINITCVCSLRCPAMLCTYTILSSVACSALKYFSTLSHKLHDFLNKITEQNTCVVILYTTCLKHFSFKEELCEK